MKIIINKELYRLSQKNQERIIAHFHRYNENMIDLDRIQSSLIEKCGLDPSRSLVVGVSGGADSVSLLDILIKLDWKVMAAHFDHHIRVESTHDAQFVRHLSAHYQVPFLHGEAEPGSLVNRAGLSVEAAAREARYRFLFHQAQIHEAQAVVVAHTADDQVETVLLHLLRGSGLDGLAAMNTREMVDAWSKKIPLVRPMLDIWRSQVEAYCRKNHLQFVQDQTNQDVTYLRNRVRLELIPMMEQINPQFKVGLQRLSTLIADDVNELDGLCEKTWPYLFKESGNGWIALHLPQISRLSAALQRRIIRKAWMHLKGELDDVDFETVERARRLIEKPTRSKRVQLSHGFWAKLEEQTLILFADESKLPLEDNYPYTKMNEQQIVVIPIPGKVELGNGWMITSELLENAPGKNWHCHDHFEAFLDADRIQHGLFIRTGRQGERFAPLGMNGKTQKLSDFFTNQKIPARLRGHLPLIADHDQIAWIPGYRTADFCRVTPSSRKIIHLCLIRMSGNKK
jgi:tRNA(Ile)-lysidine synthase